MKEYKLRNFAAIEFFATDTIILQRINKLMLLAV